MTPVTATHRILVVDDHSIVRHGLTLLLRKESDLTVCGEAGSYEEARQLAGELNPDIMLVDITLKDRNGLDLIREIHQAHPAIRCLVLSMHDEAEYADRALRSGARGYVMKEDADDVIVQAIRHVLAGELYVSPAMSNRLIRQLSSDSQDRAAGDGIASLTERERDVFECLGEGLSTRKIAEKYNLSERTVEVHRANIKKKLRCDDAAQVLREAVRWVEARK
ncbi:MAG TPA: response regulator transcription factor [Kiritimatiellia bacterium]|nr:response regulator transcription factor [Kiritimatiellia bacterium]HMO99230.1 response regulator transcription factor [Kiritimatiellia bacterium]HMP97482.1 response regulator transcription factor [Kiritimatiellia bacterium]